MPTLAPDTLTRVSLGELDGVALKGGPSSATVKSARGGKCDWNPADGPLTARACPDLLTIEWEYSGVPVSAKVELVADRYCTLGDVRAYRESDYLLSEATDEEVWRARAWAEEKIEGPEGAHRFFQPVVREGFVDRPNCATASIPVMGGYLAHDIIEVVSATDELGSPVALRASSATHLDVRWLRPGGAANVVLLMGMRPTPAGMADAVCSLAAWKLLPKAAPDNATSATVGDNFMRFVVGGVGGAATSLPEVNAFIDKYGFKDWFVR